MFEVQEITTPSQVQKVLTYLLSGKGFDFKLTDGDRELMTTYLPESIDPEENTRYWFIENESGEVVGVIGAFENHYKTGVYEMGWFSVHPDFRRQKLGAQLLSEFEAYVKSIGGRYMMIETGSGPTTAAARAFYEKHGFEQRSYFPDFAEDGEGLIHYYKKVV
jgi:ribosomal protein S18 acetylase RimI-like enzyme